MAGTPGNKNGRRSSIGTPRHGQLTGFPRRIKDNVADIFNLVQKWKKLNSDGFNILTDVCNLKIASRDSDEASCYPDGLEELCSKLTGVYGQMKTISEKMYTISLQLQKIEDIHSESPNDIFFLSWPVSKFSKSVDEIVKMHKDEIETKRLITESAAHIDLLENGFVRSAESSRNILMTYISCWLHEPDINEQTRTLLLEELLLETGHKL